MSSGRVLVGDRLFVLCEEKKKRGRWGGRGFQHNTSRTPKKTPPVLSRRTVSALTHSPHVHRRRRIRREGESTHVQSVCDVREERPADGAGGRLNSFATSTEKNREVHVFRIPRSRRGALCAHAWCGNLCLCVWSQMYSSTATRFLHTTSFKVGCAG
jgi:hypothetical protein